MSTEQAQPAAYEEYTVEQPDRAATVLKYAIAFIVVTILCVLLYALIVGVFAPPAPRTLVESSLVRAETAVKKNPGSGAAWAELAGAQWAAGDADAAVATLEQGRKKVKDASVVAINVMALRMLSADGNDAETIKRAEQYIKLAAKERVAALEKAAAKNIKVPAELNENRYEIELLTIKAGAEGNLGKWKEAVKSLDYAIELDPLGADLITLRGWAKLRGGDSKAAKADFEKALAYMPDNTSAAEGLKEANAKDSQ